MSVRAPKGHFFKEFFTDHRTPHIFLREGKGREGLRVGKGSVKVGKRRRLSVGKAGGLRVGREKVKGKGDG